MSYSGNPSLSADVKERILGTFGQTLDLAREGSRQEALLGCDFVLRLDPLFEPARRLQERLKSGVGPLTPAELAQIAPDDTPAADDPFSALDGLGVELPDLNLVSGDQGLLQRFQDLFQHRRFADLVELAEREGAALAADPQLQQLASSAQDRLEAEPYLKKFLGAATDALAAGRLDDAKKNLAKVRSLEADHPELGRLQQALDAAGGVSPVAVRPGEALLAATSRPAAAPSDDMFSGTESESDRRIRELLNEGQAAFDSGDPQGAIDSWSRIFLIDIDHQEAARRIESARWVKAETERQVEEIFHEGLGHLENGDLEGARRSFERVLEIQPTYFAAQEYLQQLASGTVPVVTRPSAPRESADAASASSLPMETPPPGEELSQEILVPPEPGQAKRGAGGVERRPTKVAVAKEGRAKMLFLGLGGAVLLLALAGGWFLYQRWDSLFPNSTSEAPKQAATEDPLARAEKLQKEGKGALARSILRRIQPSDKLYDRAQKLLSEWDGAGGAATSDAAQATSEGGDENAVRRAALLGAARAASGETRYLDAFRLAAQADSIAKLEGDDARFKEELRQRLAPIIKYVDLFQEQEWELGLRDLWQLHDANPNDHDIKQLIVDSYYDLGLRELRRGDPAKAVERFQEALNVAPDDVLVRRAQTFAQSYRSRDKDLLYRIYVKYLPTR